MSSPTATLDPRPVAALDAYPVMRYPTRAYQPDRASTPPARSPDQPSQTAKAPQNGAFAARRLDKPHHISAGTPCEGCRPTPAPGGVVPASAPSSAAARHLLPARLRRRVAAERQTEM